jgi:hypothetical protein
VEGHHLPEREPPKAGDGMGVTNTLAFILLAVVAFAGCCWAAKLK